MKFSRAIWRWVCLLIIRKLEERSPHLDKGLQYTYSTVAESISWRINSVVMDPVWFGLVHMSCLIDARTCSRGIRARGCFGAVTSHSFTIHLGEVGIYASIVRGG